MHFLYNSAPTAVVSSFLPSAVETEISLLEIYNMTQIGDLLCSKHCHTVPSIVEYLKNLPSLGLVMVIPMLTRMVR